jgi:hypothetical protein
MEGKLSVSAPKNTLAYQRKGRPLTMKRSIETADITALGSRIREFSTKHGSSVQPETEAIRFYLANHAMKELEFRFDVEEPLPDWAMAICNKYHEVSSLIAMRAFYYLVLITAREARHNSQKESMHSKIKAQFGAGPAMALLHYPDHNSVEKVTDVFDKYSAGARVGEVCRSIVHTFYKGSFSNGFGGKKWGVVADCMTSYVTGDYTAEMMLDTVWTLCHNGGPIFNKGMLYEHYNSTALQQVLDIQRAGQIPRLVLSPYGKFVSAETFVDDWSKEFAQMVVKHIPSPDWEPGKKVDFGELKKLGAIGDHSHLVSKVGTIKKTASALVEPWAQAVKVSPTEQPTEKTHFIIAQHKGLMFQKLERKDL